MSAAMPYIVMAVRALVVFVAVMSVVPLLVWFERRGASWIQHRRGPNLIEIFGVRNAGLLIPIGDLIKFIFKEDIIPNRANRLYYVMAPMLLITAALITYAVIPFGPTRGPVPLIPGVSIPPQFGGYMAKFIVADVNIGVLYILAVSGLGVYGLILAGWASNSKYPLLGGLRATAQVISYEIPMGMAIVGVLLMAGTVDLGEIVYKQGGVKWFVIPQFLGFVVFVTALFAETNRLPFDLPEGESEIVAGYHTEYGSMKFMLFYFAEYIAIVTGSMLLVTLYLGGWNMPGITTLMTFAAKFLTALRLPPTIVSLGATLVPTAVFAVKTILLMVTFVWVRWTLPRFRYDQLMRLGWKVLLPLSLINIMLTAFVMLVR